LVTRTQPDAVKAGEDRIVLRSRRVWVPIGLAAVLVSALHCEQPVAREGTAAPVKSSPAAVEPITESNIIRVSKFFSADPWLSFASDGSGKVDGVRITVYLEGPSAPKGVFGDGTMVVEMYRLDTDKHGRETATSVYKCELPPEQAYPWRAKKPTGMGWGYGLRLQWPAELDVQGKQVAFVVRYLRTDGRVVSSSRQVVKVPAPGVTP
jgi:hypothetical protein